MTVSSAPIELTAPAAERGFRLTWIATVVFFAGFYSLLEPLTRHLIAVGLNDAEIGLVLGSFGIAALIGRPFAGMLADRYGSRPVMLVGAGALLIGSAFVPMVADLPGLLGLRLLQSAGYVAFTTAGTALAVRLSPSDRRAGRMAIFGVAANVAVSLAPALVSFILPHIPLSAAFWLVGAFAVLAAMLIGVVPTAPVIHGSGGSGALPAHIWPAVAITLCTGVGFGAFFHFAPILAERRGPYPPGLLYTAYGFAIIAARFLVHRQIDRISTRHAIVLAAVLMAAGLALAAFGLSLPILLIAVALIAAGSGIAHPALLAHHARLLPDSPGKASAIFYIGFDLGLGAGGWLLGLALQLGGLTALYLCALVVVVLGAMLTAWLRGPDGNHA
ncbi:MAG: MFS transporter [Oscillochloris sp.]|nr:MFS transporter [Oscillochloris sp.]